MTETQSPLRVGFDLDGVILYNPARIVRPIVTSIKRVFFKKKTTKFYIPQTPAQQFMWELFHASSIFVAPGFEEAKQLAREGKIEAYIITARYSFLQKGFLKWMKKIGALECMKGCFNNMQDEQPHLYKERMVKELKLDIFVEDNWDIVSHLNTTVPATKTLWIYNILDRKKEYQYKFPSLKNAVEFITSQIKK